MSHHFQHPRRNSLRLNGYNYSTEGAYFITICTHQRKYLFGKIIDGEMILNEFGKVTLYEWFKSQYIRNEIKLYEHEFVVMPNHIHGIVWIVNVSNCNNGKWENVAGADGRSPLQDHVDCQSPQHGKPGALSRFVSGFKSAVTVRINKMRNTPGHPVWQRGFYDHIIRNAKDLYRIQQYIRNNPYKWHFDRFHK